jgi:hypothetical protein
MELDTKELRQGVERILDPYITLSGTKETLGYRIEIGVIVARSALTEKEIKKLYVLRKQAFKGKAHKTMRWLAKCENLDGKLGIKTYNVMAALSAKEIKELYVMKKQQTKKMTHRVRIGTKERVDMTNDLEKGTIGASSTLSAKEIEDTQFRKYKSQQGHGWAAEDANALNDRYKGKKVEKVGVNNEKNGPDRIADGVKIQTKYYNSADGSVNAAFDETTGTYRYEGQVLEVPKDQYEEALELMKEKIKEGKVPGYSDPEKAGELVKEGSVTYKQAVNIAKAGNIDSLWFDVKTQLPVCGCAFGISFIVSYAVGVWNGVEPKKAFKNAFGCALATGSVALLTGVGTSQLFRTSFGRSIAAFTTKFSKNIVGSIYKTKLGKDIIHKIASAITGKALAGAAAKSVVNKLTKVLGSNAVTATISGVVATAPDAYKAIISRSISPAQFVKNLTVTAGGIGGGVGGAWGGAVLGGAIGTAVPVIGNVIGAAVGGAIGGLAGGFGGGAAAKGIADGIAPDDAEIMLETMEETIEELAFEYMLTENELENVIVPKIKDTVDAGWLKRMYQYSGGRNNIGAQKQYVRNQFERDFEDVLKNRVEIKTPKLGALKWLAFKTGIELAFRYYWIRFTAIFSKKSRRLLKGDRIAGELEYKG